MLFQFEASEDNEIQFFPNAPIDVENSPSVVAINVCSPTLFSESVYTLKNSSTG